MTLGLIDSDGAVFSQYVDSKRALVNDQSSLNVSLSSELQASPIAWEIVVDTLDFFLVN
jgi:hypothetical protein